MSDLSDCPPSEKIDAHFSGFSWLHKSPGYTTPIETTSDIANGVGLILEAIESSDLARGSGVSPVFSTADCGTLMRLAISSLRLLAESADAQIDDDNQKARTK